VNKNVKEVFIGVYIESGAGRDGSVGSPHEIKFKGGFL